MAALLLSSIWKPAVLAALVVGLVAYRAVLVRQRNDARTQVAGLQTAELALQASNAAMKDAVAQQNAALETMGQQLQAAQAAAQAREAQYAQSGAEMFGKEIAHAKVLAVAQVPSGCEGAIKWGNGQGPQLGKW